MPNLLWRTLQTGARQFVVQEALVDFLVDAHDYRRVVVLRGGGDDYLLRAGGDVGRGLVGVGVASGRLDDEVDAHFLPRELRGIGLGEGSDSLSVYDEVVSVYFDGAREAAEDGVVLEKIRERGRRRQVVDSDYFKFVFLAVREERAKGETPDASETVDCNLILGHDKMPSL